MSVKDLRGWLDYDRDKLPALTSEERIDYFEKRVFLVAVNPLQRILATEITPTDDSSALLIFGMAACCAIEALGKFLEGGRGSNRHRFAAFVARYMTADFQQVQIASARNVEVVWKHFRNGLAHGFAVCHGGFEGHPSEPYFRLATVCGQDCLELNPTRFFDDFRAGFERYLGDLRAAADGDRLRRDFDCVFEDVFINGN
jgi:hypothetical protein